MDAWYGGSPDNKAACIANRLLDILTRVGLEPSLEITPTGNYFIRAGTCMMVMTDPGPSAKVTTLFSGQMMSTTEGTSRFAKVHFCTNECDAFVRFVKTF